MTPEELQQAKDRLAEYKRDLESVSEVDQERLKAVMKLENQLNDVQAKRLSDFQLQMAEFDEMVKDSQKEIASLNRELTDAEKEYREAKKTGDQAAIAAAQVKIDLLDDEIEKQEEIIELVKEQKKEQEDLNSTTGNLISTLTGVQAEQTGVIGAIQKSMNQGMGFGGAMNALMGSMTTSFKAIVTPINVVASIAAKVVESTVAMVMSTDQALANFNKLTTASGKLNRAIFEASVQTKQFGVNMEQTVQVAGELFTSMTSFRDMTEETVTEVTTLAAALNKVGLSTKDFGEISDLAMKGFSMNLTEANNLQMELLGVAKDLNVPLSQIGANFNSSMNELAKYGPAGIEVFKELAAMAQAAGVEMETLLGVAKGFDTIEGAAEKTSKLNAILGSTMNTMEMLNATESERLMMIKRSVEATGRSFDSMDRHEKQAIAAAAGISSMSDAQKFFNTSGAEFEAQMAKLTGEAGNLEDATGAATSITEKFRLMMETTAVAIMPLIKLVTSLLSALLFLLTPIFAILNGVIGMSEAFGEFIGVGKEMGILLTAGAVAGGFFYLKFLLKGTHIEMLKMLKATFLTKRGLIDFATSIPSMLKTVLVDAKNAIIGKAMALKTSLTPSFIAAKSKLIAFGGSIKTSLMGALTAAKTAIIAKATALKTTLVGALTTAKGAIIAKAVALKTTLVGALVAAKAAIIAKAVALKTTLVGALVAAKAAVIAKAVALKTTLVGALIVAKGAIIAKAVALKTTLVGALIVAKGAIIAKAVALKTTLIGALIVAKGAVIAKAIALKTIFIGALVAAKAAIISKATTIYTSFMGAMTTAISAVASFAVSIYTSFIAPVFAAVASVFTFAASLIASAIPALVAVTGAVISFTVALLTNPIVLIGMAIAAVAYLIYDNFDMLFSFMISGFTMVGDIFSTIGNGLASIFFGIVDGLTGIVNAMIDGVNFMIDGLNTISFTIPDWVPFVGGETFGIDIPLIPYLEKGGEISTDGAAYLHQGEKVVPAAQVQQLDDSIETASTLLAAAPMIAMTMMNPVTMIAGAVGAVATTGLGGNNDDVVEAIQENTAAIKALIAQGGGPTEAGGTNTITLEINERQLGKVVTKVLNDKNPLTLG